MKEIKLKGLDETIYETTLENGLKIYMWVNKKVNTFKGTITFMVGSEDVDYSIGKKNIHKIFGIPHYLEHILCKNENGSSILGDFQKLGSYNNASTFAYRTTYEFVGNQNLKENIKLLMHMTQEKVFDEDAFESERGPILEEARRCEDSIDRLVYIELNKMLYKNYPNKEYGVGNQKDIKKITLEDLKETYKTFYHPENSFVVITGNINPYEIEEWFIEIEKDKSFPKFQHPKIKKYKEPTSIICKEKEIKANVEIPLVAIAIKTPLKVFETDLLTTLDALQLTLTSNFGSTSSFREELMNKKLITSLSCYTEKTRDYLNIAVISKTKYPKEVIGKIKEKLRNVEILEEEISRKKKCEIASLVLGYEAVEEVNDFLSYTVSKFGTIFDNEKEILENLDIKTIKNVVTKVDFSKIAALTILPKE
ncbi:MAG: insulinase family protein [Bacilli bacterium]|nr:insulinase family protein [Bacilli bacterium]